MTRYLESRLGWADALALITIISLGIWLILAYAVFGLGQMLEGAP